MHNEHNSGQGPGFLAKLGRDTRGATLAMMAASIIPFAGLVGGAMDIARMYITKTRLQHACDAGALAGRKQMGSGTWGTDDSTAAFRFFDANYRVGAYGSTDRVRNFTESAGKVTGTASATVPMTLMRILGKSNETLSVTCDAEMRLPNTDIMFVLDTTGSMDDVPTGDTQDKITSLKVAVKCFYEIVARLDTDATCTTGTPSGGTGNQVQIRFGFVPYSTNVNVGKLLNPDWFANSRDYQTREAIKKTVNTTSTTVSETSPSTSTSTNTGAWQDIFLNGYQINSSDSCQTNLAPTTSSPTNTGPTTGQANNSGNSSSVTVTSTSTTTTTEYRYEKRYSALVGWYCQKQRRNTDTTTTTSTVRTTTTVTTPTQVFDKWRYAKLPVNVGLLKNGTAWNNSFEWPVGPLGINKTITWDGCIEERQTVSRSSYWPRPNDAKDLDIDTPPTVGDATTQWGMVLPGLIYTRKQTSSEWTTGTVETTDEYVPNYYYVCPTESKLLQAWPDATQFDNYVDSLSPQGNTYHDIGLIWGGRLMSPDGIFAANNAVTSQGGDIDRHMIFMTDGDACTGVNNYTAYGVNWFDRRTTGDAAAPTEGCTTTGTLTQQVNARTESVCNAIKNKNITLWVISFGYVDPNTVTRLTNCATSGRYFSANNSAELQSTFATIANQISQLRLTN